MSDLAQSQVRTPSLQIPVAVVARSALACDDAVLSVMIVDEYGRILAYERALEQDGVAPEGRGHPLLFFSPSLGILISMRLRRESKGNGIQNHLKNIIGNPNLPLTQ